MALLYVVLGAGLARHEGEEAAGGVAGGVGDPLQGVAHDHRPGHGGGHRHLGQRYRHHHILAVIVASLQQFYLFLKCLSICLPMPPFIQVSKLDYHPTNTDTASGTTAVPCPT